jgi:hypothetical protein
MGERRGVYRISVGNLRERNHFQDPGVDGRKLLRWIFRKLVVGVEGIGSIWLGIGAGGRVLANAVMKLRVP